ncbi:MAG: hypothetical protein AB2A00_11335 [Myxococcota bacterium]
MSGCGASSGGHAWWVLVAVLASAPVHAQSPEPATASTSTTEVSSAPPLPAPSPSPADVPEVAPPTITDEEPPPLPPVPVLPGTPSTTIQRPPPPPQLLTPTGLGKGPGLPWQVVLMLQLLSYATADLGPYLGCVVASWVMSLAVPFGPGVLLPLTVSAILIPVAAVVSGCASGALLQWIGDRLGTQRGRLACVGCCSISLSALTYSLVIAPILLGMGFFAVAAYSALTTYFIGSEIQVPGPFPWADEAVGYSFTAGGVLLAVVTVAAGFVLAPLLGFAVRPGLVALVYQFTSREREPGEEQWPPSVVGERSDRLPWRRRLDDEGAAPRSAAPAPDDTSTSVAY